MYNILQHHSFSVWKSAYRNIIGIDDMHAIINCILQEKSSKNSTINIANPHNYSVQHIIKTIENFLEKKAVFIEIDRGDNYEIDTTLIATVIQELKIPFDDHYLSSLLKQYYHSR